MPAPVEGPSSAERTGAMGTPPATAGESDAVAFPMPSGGPAPAISVILINYRRTQFIAGAVRSVLAQDLVDARVETILVANHLEEEAARSFEAAGVRIVRSERLPLGEKVAEGLALAQGGIVTFLEDDDRYEPERLREVLRRFREDPALVYYHNSFSLIGPDEAPYPYPFHRDAAVRRIARVGRIYRPVGAAPGGWAPFVGVYPGFNDSCIALRRAAFTRWIPFIARSGLVTDECLYFAAAATGGAMLQDDARLTRIMVHENSISRPTTPDGRPLSAEQMRSYSQRTESDREALLEVARASGRADLIRSAEAELAVQRIIRHLRDPSKPRGEALAPVAIALRRPETLAVRNFPAAVALGGASLVVPSVARWAYRGARRIAG